MGKATASADVLGMVFDRGGAVRVYKAGTRLQYACEIYNAVSPVPAGAQRVARQRARADGAAMLAPPSGKPQRFAAAGAFKLGEHLPSGNYVLQVATATAAAGNGGRALRAVQHMDFEVR